MNRCAAGILVLLAATLAGAAPAGPTRDPRGAAAAAADDLYATGKQLFDEYAPPDVKEEYEFPDRAQWEQVVAKLQAALDGNDPRAVARLEPEARTLLRALETMPGSAEYIDWLKERLDYIEASRQMVVAPPTNPRPGFPSQTVPAYDLWLQRLKARPKPADAARYVEALVPVFVAAGVPGELVWLAEVESGFNPFARSPVGARGLFQLMPGTAEELGLSTFLPDERADPRKSAAAAAQLLKTLHQRFGDWPLALAAYNAGSGRIRRALDQHRARTFAEIAAELPFETRMYVPKVLALVQVRAGVALAGAR